MDGQIKKGQRNRRHIKNKGLKTLRKRASFEGRESKELGLWLLYIWQIA